MNNVFRIFMLVSLLTTPYISNGLGNEAPVLNLNSEMELGRLGEGVPGYRMIVNRIDCQTVAANPDKLYMPQTVNDGNPGQCMMIPGYKDLNCYQTEFEFPVTEDCEIEIAFDAKAGDDVNGQIHSDSNFWIDFRSFPDYKAGETRMLSVMSFNPTKQWKHFSKTFPVKKTRNYYAVWIMGSVKNGAQGTLNSLYIDNLRIRKTSQTIIYPDEIGIIPDNLESVYSPNDDITFTIRSLLNSNKETVPITLNIIADYNQKQILSFNTVLKRKEGTESQNGRNIYEGTLTFKTDVFGSFSTICKLDNQQIKSVGGDFTIVHPIVKHKRFSPGWSLGYDNGDVSAVGRGGLKKEDNYWIQIGGGFEHQYRMARLSGASIARVWGNWRFIEAEENKFNSDIYQLVLNMLRKYDIEVLFVLGGSMMPDTNAQTAKESFEKDRTALPKYLLQYYKMNTSERGSIQPPMNVYKRYLDFVLKNWGRQINIWEVFNEPGLGGTPADKYVEYLRLCYKTIKDHDKNSIVLGNGVTGDFGMNVVQWCSQLNNADSDYEKYLDGIAFHPYGGCLDYQDGNYFLYTKCIASIRDTLKYKKPMWNTECYYLRTARKTQIEDGYSQSRYGANEIVRHMLESLENGVVAMTAPCSGSFYKNNAPATIPAPSEVCAAMNTLSFMLKDMDNLSMLKLNRFIKTGVFHSEASQSNAIGYVYDLRPSACTWLLPSDLKGVEVYDIFGNHQDNRKFELSFEAYYLKGSQDSVNYVLNNSKFIPHESVKINARTFKERICIEARNTTGSASTADVKIAPNPSLNLPEKIQFAFGDNIDYNMVKISNGVRGLLKPIAIDWQGFINNEPVAGGQMNILPDTGNYEIPYGDTKTLNFDLNRGSKAMFWADEKYLHIKVDVLDTEIISANGKELWSGSSLEVFIDANPFYRMDQPKILSSTLKDSLNVYQYVFAPVPSSTGNSILVINKKLRGDLTTAAQGKAVKNPDGYTLETMIPWSELRQMFQADDILGIDFEINHVMKKGSFKESLGTNTGKSWCERLHYPLFRVPEQVFKQFKANSKENLNGAMIENSDFKDQKYGDPAVWIYTINGSNQIKASPVIGMAKSGMLIDKVLGTERAMISQQITLNPLKYGIVLAQVLIKTENILKTDMNSRDKTYGVFIGITFKKGGKYINSAYALKEPIAGTAGWAVYQFYATIPIQSESFEFKLGLAANTCGKLQIDNIEVLYL